MKKLPILALLVVGAGGVLAFIALNAPEPTYVPPQVVPRQIEATPSADQSLRSFDVAGMCCDGCSTRLFAAAIGHAGVGAAAVRVEEGRLEALCDGDVDVEELARALTFDKYKVTPRQ